MRDAWLKAAAETHIFAPGNQPLVRPIEAPQKSMAEKTT
jgi:hypothetical protein